VESNDNKTSLAGLNPESLELLLGQKGLDKKYSGRLLYWIYRRAINSFTGINDIPKSYLADLGRYFNPGLFEPYSSCVSSDGSVRYLFKNAEGLLYETVYLPEGSRHTVCVSVQSGCRMGCRFCSTGRYGWRGDLSAGEMINQVISLPHTVTHVVFMGMGEAGDNVEEVIKACRILIAEWGLALGRTKVTVSTVGVTPSLKRLLDETECNITLSLHSPFPEERRRSIPAEARWPSGDSLALIRDYPAKRHRRFTVAYVMIKGVNDSEKHLGELIKILSGTQIRINLLSYHPVEGDIARGSDRATLLMFKHLLVTSGIEATIRRSRGADIDAACGMLVAKAAPGDELSIMK